MSIFSIFPSAHKKIHLGMDDFTLRDLHLGLGIIGSTGTGKTAALLQPALEQILAICNQTEGEYSKIGGLIIDPYQTFTPSIIASFQASGRPLSDLIILDGESIDTYNPLDPNELAEDNAIKLIRTLRLPNHSYRGENTQWSTSEQKTLGSFLLLLELIHPKDQVTLTLLIQTINDEAQTKSLCGQADKILAEKEDALTDADFERYLDALNHIIHTWMAHEPSNRQSLIARFNDYLGEFATNATLQKTFCAPSSFTFQEVINEGKIVIIHNTHTRANLTIVCSLIADFQRWAKRRIGSAARHHNLNTSRSLLLLSDEYQDYFSCSQAGDYAFAGLTRPPKVIQLLATQSYDALKNGRDATKVRTFIQNIGTWIFLRAYDTSTKELAQFLAKQGGLTESFEISQFCTATPQNSPEGPWFTEGMTYRYQDGKNPVAKARIVRFPLN